MANRFNFSNKGKIRSAHRVGVEGQRSILAYHDLAKSTARRQITTAASQRNRAKGLGVVDGAQIKSSMIKMVETTGAPAKYMNAVSQMNESVLARMYRASNLAFDVFYNYEGINYEKDGYYTVSDTKLSDFDWFIEQYNRFSAGL